MRKYIVPVVLGLLMTPAVAGPPSSCAHKFIGTWSYSAGTTTVNADGTANPHCFACVPVQTWTCQGNTYLFSNSGAPGEFTAVLVDSNHLSGSGYIATRVGGSVAASGAATRSAPTSAPANRDAEVAMRAARAAEQYCTYADQMQAAGQYRNAEDAFRTAGDERRAVEARRLANTASAKADRCEARAAKTASQPDTGSATRSKSKDCSAAVRYKLKLQLEGNDTAALKEVLREHGCTP